MPRPAADSNMHRGPMWLAAALGLFLFSACSSRNESAVDGLNRLSYRHHYVDLDSTERYARMALELAGDYPSGRAQAYNNLAFVDIARMEYGLAGARLDSVALASDDQLELLVADVQCMRLCQRTSSNKEFHGRLQAARARARRIREEALSLTPAQGERLLYAETEMWIVASAFYHYVGMEGESEDALRMIDPYGEILADTAQYVNYLYQVGAGGLTGGRPREEALDIEFDCLFRCLDLAERKGYAYWRANALQSISEHLVDGGDREFLARENPLAMAALNPDRMPGEHLAGYLAQKAVEGFAAYGDPYQLAASYRTLAGCFWDIGDFESALICLDRALSDTVVYRAPELVAGIREACSMAHAAMGDKAGSDFNRNMYLNIRESTRLDRQLEAEREAIVRRSSQLSWAAAGLVALIALAASLLALSCLSARRASRAALDSLHRSLRRWEEAGEAEAGRMREEREGLSEALAIETLHLAAGKRRFVDNKAKISLAMDVMPCIDRIVGQVARMGESGAGEDRLRERYAFVRELTDRINAYNDVLTHWIRLQQGQVRLRVESFPLSGLFGIIARSRASFLMKGVELEVMETDAVVKADRVLTLFMLNTLADNARKFTPAGGKVTVDALSRGDCVEVSVRDTGRGMTAEELSRVFDRNVSGGHGFGLANCRGIIDRYRKSGRLFSVCSLGAESERGRGSRFFFRLPPGTRALAATLCLAALAPASPRAAAPGLLERAGAFADSAYYRNLDGLYDEALEWADSAICCLNAHHDSLLGRADGPHMARMGHDGGTPAEVAWHQDGLPTDYEIIRDVRNEVAVAAMALQIWDLYEYSNMAHAALCKDLAVDGDLAGDCDALRRSNGAKSLAVVLLAVVLLAVMAAHGLHYRRVLGFRRRVEEAESLLDALLSGTAGCEMAGRMASCDAGRAPGPLGDLVRGMGESLARRTSAGRSERLAIEAVGEELSRLRWEEGRYYLANNVIDNCLSALKHETMYYPSRIRQLVENPRGNLAALGEVASYYRQLYSILGEQVRRQAASAAFDSRPQSLSGSFGVDLWARGDATLLSYLSELLGERFPFRREDVSAREDGRCVTLDIPCPGVSLSEGECRDLFTPSVDNIPLLVCRQIAREMGQAANLYGCGISARPSAAGGVALTVVLPGAGRGHGQENNG